MSHPAQRLTLYRMLMDCGQLPDVLGYVNADHLQADWPRIRRLTSRRLIALWESRLPVLAVIAASPPEPSAGSGLVSRLEGVVKRIPTDMAQFAGPAEGTVWLPIRLAWSGQSQFDVSDRGDRLTLYTTLLDCGQAADLVAYVHADHLRRDWPRIRRLTSRRVVALWESRLPALASCW